jgi:hypothetical protein
MDGLWNSYEVFSTPYMMNNTLEFGMNIEHYRAPKINRASMKKIHFERSEYGMGLKDQNTAWVNDLNISNKRYEKNS